VKPAVTGDRFAELVRAGICLVRGGGWVHKCVVIPPSFAPAPACEEYEGGLPASTEIVDECCACWDA
jgi:hypothetical protein